MMLATAVLMLLTAASASRAQTLTGLGVLAGGAHSYATDLSADGSVVVGNADKGTLGSRAFRWTSAGGMMNLGLFGGATYTYASRCSANGSVVVGQGGTSQPVATSGYRWLSGSGFTTVGGTGTYAFAVSGDGSTVVGVSPFLNNTEAYRWTSGGGMVSLGSFFPGQGSVAQAVNANGSVIVGVSGLRASRWTLAGGMTDLGVLPGGTSSSADCITPDGSVVVGACNTPAGPRLFRWTSGTGMVNLGTMPGSMFISPTGVSGDGGIIVGIVSDTAGNGQPFLWTRTGGMRDVGAYMSSVGIDLTGWTLSSVHGISADGRTIIGSGWHFTAQFGRNEAWRATIPAQCAADFNGSGGISSQDIFDFLAAWFNLDPRADFNGVNGINAQDIFNFLSAWFAGC